MADVEGSEFETQEVGTYYVLLAKATRHESFNIYTTIGAIIWSVGNAINSVEHFIYHKRLNA